MENYFIRRAETSDLALLKEFHIANHLEETCHCPGERENQISDLETDFPQLYSREVFNQGKFWVTIANEKIVGTIGLMPDKYTEVITWLNTFSVAKDMRGKGLGT